MTIQQLKKEFLAQYKPNDANDEGERDFEYMRWLEAKIISSNVPVSGNEGLPKSIDESPEVAVCYCRDEHLHYVDGLGVLRCTFCQDKVAN